MIHQLPVAADRVQGLQHQRAQQPLDAVKSFGADCPSEEKLLPTPTNLPPDLPANSIYDGRFVEATARRRVVRGRPGDHMRSGGHIVRFGEFTFDSETRQLTRDGKHIHLSPKAFELLSVLVRNRPRAMSKAELQEDLWPATFVSESNLPGLVKEIRRAVGPEIAATVVRTVHGYGYSFAANAQEATGCDVNSAGNEASPFLVHAPGGPALYFSSNVAGGYSAEADGVITGDDDIYRSEWQAGTFQARQLVDGVNSPANDSRPNLSHDGQEIIFDSNRPGTLGGPDIFYAFRDHPNDSWSAPQNVGPNVNTESAETRASMSWDGTVLVFGSNRPGGEGMADIYMATRIRLTGTR